MPDNQASTCKPIPIFTRDDVEIILGGTYYIIEGETVRECFPSPNIARDGSKCVYRYGVDRTCPVCVVIPDAPEDRDITMPRFIHSGSLFGHKFNAIGQLMLDKTARIVYLNTQIDDLRAQIKVLDREYHKLHEANLNSVQ